MSESIYRFSVGSFECVSISDVRADQVVSSGAASDDWSFVNATQVQVKRVFDAHREGSNAWIGGSFDNCLFVDTGHNRILIDPGSGEHALPERGHLLRRLSQAGIDNHSIDTVILTHGHYDHIGSSTDATGKPMFPNARYKLTHDEFRHWTEVPTPFVGHINTEWREYAETTLAAVRDRLDLIAPEGEIVPSITATPAPGHTPGQIALLVQDGDSRLFCTADTFHHPCELVEPDWYFDFDHDPVQTVTTRRSVLDWAARERILVHVYHCPFPGLGRIVRDGEHWEWVRP